MYFRQMILVLAALTLIVAGAVAGGEDEAAPSATTVTFYFPVQAAGPLTKIMEGYVAEFHAQNPDIKVAAVYSGSYDDTQIKAITAAKSGNPPTVAQMAAADMYLFLNKGVVRPIDDFVKTKEDKEWLDGFMPVYLSAAEKDGHTWCVPYARSTAIMFYNKDAFKEGGLDPEKPPTTWTELVEYGKAVTKKGTSSKMTRWGIGIPGSIASGYWMMNILAAQNGLIELSDKTGTKTFLDDPKVVEALQFWVDLDRVHGIHPPGVLEWGTTPKDFVEQRLAMIWTTTGNLTNIKNQVSTFSFGVARMPGNPKSASVLGGGGLYIFEDAPKASQQAGFKFVRFLTSAEKMADYNIKTGYIAARDDAWETDAMKKYIKEFPAVTVARDQIPLCMAEVATLEQARLKQLLADAVAAAATGQKSPKQALADAQNEMDRVLAKYR